ncbi:S-adenosyl-L-methionine-dependent methyltransferase [Coprinopsis marcescibilis]|uniref:S-adenosyl-L-methionine-dependent methyltransferase n=1 Tax=Coprinopsis marcescibilis TaxID=230819 RepID=A0A5C3L3S3_COPMA|nr:S-adenosyl-L-methionine-dependent methyltransferase [Coprinopsis marcescibilis]
MASAEGSSLLKLVSLITNATAIVEEHFKATSKPYVPSLNDTEPHPLDTKPYDSELRKAVQTIEAACAQLCATVAKPISSAINLIAPHCLNVALKFKIADVLLNEPNGMHINDLSRKLGLDPNKLGRILRLLATKHVFREVTHNVFANNRISVQYLSSNPVWSFGIHFTGVTGQCSSELTNVLKDPEWGPSLDPRKTALNKYTGFDGDLFEFFEGGTPEGAMVGAQFGIAMIGWGNVTEAGSVVHGYPWDKLPEGASVCDVGGGIGNITLQLAKAHPHLKLKLQDIPERIRQAKDVVWPKSCPEAIETDRIEFKAIDFFVDPPIPGCDVYYLKNIIHDWSDNDCIKILRGVRKAMSPHSRVLIQEFVMQHASRASQSTKNGTESIPFQPEAPEPLLPNYGAGRIRQYVLDIHMLALLNAQERPLEELIRLAKEADLEFVKLWEIGEMAAVEFRPGPGSTEVIVEA